jgi:malonyl-CoA/methylmalonyl-CoA synthetase
MDRKRRTPAGGTGTRAGRGKDTRGIGTPARQDANLYTLLAAGFPEDRSACAIEARRPNGGPLYYTWDDIEQATGKLASFLASLRLAAGARIAVQVEKSPEALLLYLACLRAGYVYLPLNVAYRESEIDYFVGNAEPEVVVCSPRNHDWVAAVAARHKVPHVFTLGEDRDGSLLAAAAGFPSRFATVRRGADDLAAILYTSGTTGRSKGAMLSHGNLAANAVTLHHYWRWRRGDVLLHALPIFHVHGLFVAAHGALLSGSRTIWLARFDPAAVIEALPRATVFMGVPTMYVRLLDDPRFGRDCCAGMRLFISGSAPLLPETFRQFEERTGMRILERYGMSETIMLTSNPYDGNRVAGTVGLPLPGVEVRVVDDLGLACGPGEVGAIQVRGPNVFRGYWRMPEKTREEFTDDGWFRTGDVGRFDANGYLSIVGRSKDLIITGGYNVYPKEIESVLDELPEVRESAVVGIPDRDFGESVAAAVVPRDGARIDVAALVATVKGRIAGFKVPRKVLVVDELPRNQMGKVQKNLLRERLSVEGESG